MKRLFLALADGISAVLGYIAQAMVLILIASKEMAKELRTAPLTAAFGMFVIFTYAIAGIFAPWIAPHGEAESCKLLHRLVQWHCTENRYWQGH